MHAERAAGILGRVSALERRAPNVLLAVALAWATCGAGGDSAPPPLPPVAVAPPHRPAPPRPKLAALIAAARQRAGRDADAASRGVFLYSVDVDYRGAIETGELFHAFNASHGKGLSRCYEPIAHERPAPHGRVRLQVTLAKGGHASSAKLLSSFAPRMNDCLLGHIGGWSFPYLSENGGARLTFEIGFSR